MRTNKFSIGGLIGVHLSSIVNWGYLNNFKPVYFFWRKDFARTKTCHKRKSGHNQNKVTLNNKSNNFSRAHTLLGVTCFCAREIFSSKKKKNEQAWNYPDSLNMQYYWKRSTFNGETQTLRLFFGFKRFFLFSSARTLASLCRILTAAILVLKKMVELWSYQKNFNPKLFSVYQHQKQIVRIWNVTK